MCLTIVEYFIYLLNLKRFKDMTFLNDSVLELIVS